MTIMSKARKTLGGGRRTPGSAKGQVTMAPDFDALTNSVDDLARRFDRAG